MWIGASVHCSRAAVLAHSVVSVGGNIEPEMCPSRVELAKLWPCLVVTGFI